MRPIPTPLSMQRLRQYRALAQAMALPELCNQLKLAKGLCELALDLDGRAAHAVPAKLPTISRLTQLRSLQIHGIANDVEDGHLTAALVRLTQLTRLSLRFVHEANEYVDWDDTDGQVYFPWAAAICGLTNLQQLNVTADTDINSYCSTIFKGCLPASFSALTALQKFAVLGMDTWQVHSGSNQLLLAALPALETAALHLHTRAADFPGLSRQRRVVLSRLVSLKLGLRLGAQPGQGYQSTCLPTIVAPALTELSLEDMALAPDSGGLQWLPGLPRLRRLRLTDIQTASSELPEGMMACTGLTELVLEGVMVMESSNTESDSSDRGTTIRYGGAAGGRSLPQQVGPPRLTKKRTQRRAALCSGCHSFGGVGHGSSALAHGGACSALGGSGRACQVAALA